MGKINDHEFVLLLPRAQVSYIESKLIEQGIEGEDLLNALDSKLCDLSDTIDLAEFEWRFGKESRWPDYIMRTLRECQGLEPEDTSQDAFLEGLPANEAFDELLKYEGIVGYTQKLKNMVSDLYGVYLDGISRQGDEISFDIPEGKEPTREQQMNGWEWLYRKQYGMNILVIDNDGFKYNLPAILFLPPDKAKYSDLEKWCLDLPVKSYFFEENLLVLRSECDHDRTQFILEGTQNVPAEYETKEWSDQATAFKDASAADRITYVARDITNIYRNMTYYRESAGYRYDELEEIRKGLEKHVDVRLYAKAGKDGQSKFNAAQMAQIRIGLESGLNVRLYANPKLTEAQMERQRLNLSERMKEAGPELTL